MLEMGVVRDLSTESDSTIRVILDVTTYTLQMLKIPCSRGCTKSPHIHGSTVDIIAAQGDTPLEGSDKTLILFDLFHAIFFSHVELGMIILVDG
jgi:hypothetical protein